MDKAIKQILIFSIVLIQSCEKNKANSSRLIFQTGHSSFQTNDFLVCNDKMYLYFLIANKEMEDKIFGDSKIEKIVLNHNNTDYVASRQWVFSSLLPSSKLSYLVDDNQKLIHLENEKGKWLILVENNGESAIGDGLGNCNPCSWVKD